MITTLLEIFGDFEVGFGMVLPAAMDVCQGVLTAMNFHLSRLNDHPDVTAEFFRLVRLHFFLDFPDALVALTQPAVTRICAVAMRC